MKKKIVCIEDDLTQQQYYKLLFKIAKIELNLFPNPEEALNFFNSSNNTDTDLIITDYRMPILNGCEFIEKLTPSIRSKVPIIMVTSQHKDEIKELNDVSYWIKSLLRKPIDYKDFIEIVLKNIN